MTDIGWTAERTEALKTLHPTGMSMRDMAVELGGGMTRNSVIGKCHRLGLTGREKRRSASRPPRASRRQIKKMERGGRLPTHVEPELIDGIIPLGQRCSLLELNDHKCRWPVGDVGTPEFFFCGGSPVEGLSYCSYHSRVAYQPAGTRHLSDHERERRRMQAFRNREAGLWV